MSRGGKKQHEEWSDAIEDEPHGEPCGAPAPVKVTDSFAQSGHCTVTEYRPRRWRCRFVVSSWRCDACHSRTTASRTSLSGGVFSAVRLRTRTKCNPYPDSTGPLQRP